MVSIQNFKVIDMKIKKSEKKINVWKIVSIIFIGLFSLILIHGLIRVRDFRSSFSEITQEQSDSAKSIITQELQKRGDNIDDYDVRVENRILKIDVEGAQRNMIQIFLYKDEKMYLYLIDMDSEELVLYTQAEFYGWMTDLLKNKSFMDNHKPFYCRPIFINKHGAR